MIRTLKSNIGEEIGKPLDSGLLLMLVRFRHESNRAKMDSHSTRDGKGSHHERPW